MPHIIEVDQSIKIERPGDTVLAFANGISHAIIIPSQVKTEAFRALWKRGKSRKIARIMLFSACIYLLVKDSLPDIQRIIIDEEYTGQEANIRSFLWGRVLGDKGHLPPHP